MRYKVGAEQLERVPAMAYRPGGVYRATRIAPVGPAHAVDAGSGGVAVASQPRSSKSLTRTGKLHSSKSAPAVSWPFLPAPKCRLLALSWLATPLPSQRNGHVERPGGCSRGPVEGGHALSGWCRATPAGAILGLPSRWGVPRGQNCPGWGPTHAVCATTGATVCGVKAEALEVLNEDWEATCLVEQCPRCFAAVLARGRG
jgi:hypothetical protein